MVFVVTHSGEGGEESKEDTANLGEEDGGEGFTMREGVTGGEGVIGEEGGAPLFRG